jgi:hypothetical protein
MNFEHLPGVVAVSEAAVNQDRVPGARKERSRRQE